MWIDPASPPEAGGVSRADPRVLAFLRPVDAPTQPLPPETTARPRTAELPLGDASRVVELPKRRRAPPAVMPSTSPSFERAWTHYAELDGLRRSTRRLSWPQWMIVARVHGEAVLEAAVAAFIRDPKARETAARCGAPGFQVWLRQGRYENFMGANSAPTPEQTTARTVPDHIFAAVAGRFGEGAAISYLHKARMSEKRPGALVAGTAYAADWLARYCSASLSAAGVTLIVALRENVVTARHEIGKR